MKLATFGAGCFWGVQDAFEKINGVTETSAGYMGGTTKNPSYEQVCSNTTAHVEVVQIQYSTLLISFEKLLDVFFKIHDPTQKNRQGSNIGLQYRSVIFYHDENQKNQAEQRILILNESNQYQKEIVTKILPVSSFYKAEEYHQHYFKKNDYSGCTIS